jgi:tRNA/tmRNA/rRNA uracil-C5-methylase (TrmA/RlmC/RlmD family)
MTPGDRLTLEIEKPVTGGRMLARHEGAVVLVSGALPGERVEARVERLQKGTAWAAVTGVLRPSPNRVGEPNPCGGCVLAHASYEAQLDLKRLIVIDSFARLAKRPLEIDVPAVPSPPAGYRMRSRLHVEGTRLGFYLEGTHTLCEPGSTGQLLPETLALVQRLGGALGPVPGVVTAVTIVENREASERAIHLDLARDADPSRLAAMIQTAGVTGVSATHEGSSRCRDLWGSPRVMERFHGGMADWSLSHSANAFFQANRFLIEPLASAVVGAVVETPIVDLYAGVGLFGVAAVAGGKGPVVAVEGDEASQRDLVGNTAGLGDRIQVRRQPVERFLAAPDRPRRVGTVIVDPPRTGLSRAALAGVIALDAPGLVYVSCDVATFARDAQALLAARYRLERLQIFDLFPNTAHVELVAEFRL